MSAHSSNHQQCTDSDEDHRCMFDDDEGDSVSSTGNDQEDPMQRQQDTDLFCDIPPCSKRLKATVVVSPPFAVVTDASDNSMSSTGHNSGAAPVAAVVLTGISAAPPLLSALEPLDPERGFFLRSGCVATLQYPSFESDPCTLSCQYDQDSGIQVSPAVLSFSGKAHVQSMFHQALECKRRLNGAGGTLDEPVSIMLLEDWLGDRSSDTEIVIVNSVKRYNRIRKLDSEIQHVLGEDEIRLWRHSCQGTPHQLSLRNLTKLRRLLLPISVQVVHAGFPDSACCVYRVDVSMIDVWLRQCLPEGGKHDEETTGICRISATSSASIRNRIIDRLLLMGVLLRSHSNSFVGATDVLYEYHCILRLIIQTLRRVGGNYFYQGDWINLRKLKVNQLPLPLEGMGRCRRSRSEADRLEQLDIAAKRKDLWNDYHEPTMTRQARLFDGHILISEKEDGVSLEAFLKEALFMNKVNSGIPRPFVPFRSRPRMAALNLPRSAIDELKSVLFDVDGCLNREIVPDISQAKNHHYISFTNEERCGVADKRWQIPIRLGQTPGSVRTRARIEGIMRDAGLLNTAREKIHDLGLLVGGTEDQSLHHDLCRQWTFWLPHVDSTDAPTLGWEANRFAYNEAMADRYAPSSFLIGMGRSDSIFIGVQKDQIERVQDGSHCRIKLGRPHEIFKIVRESHHLVVLEAKVGCAFTGDFPHAGVRNIAPGSRLENQLQLLNRRIEKILARPFDNSEQQTSAMIEMFCQFKGLDQLCRLHCSTELVHTRITIPRNTIGYTKCWANKSTGEAQENDEGGVRATAKDIQPTATDPPKASKRKRHIEQQRPLVAKCKTSRMKGQSRPPKTSLRQKRRENDIHHNAEESLSSDPSESEWEGDE
jgi:hypothetical protein